MNRGQPLEALCILGRLKPSSRGCCVPRIGKGWGRGPQYLPGHLVGHKSDGTRVHHSLHSGVPPGSKASGRRTKVVLSSPSRPVVGWELNV